MKILHISAHMGGGVGSVIMGWVERDQENCHEIALLDYANDKAVAWSAKVPVFMTWNRSVKMASLLEQIAKADIVICHDYENPFMETFYKWPLPPCRMVTWCHKNYEVPDQVQCYPDMFVGTSPIQGFEKWIWSTGGVERFRDIAPEPHTGFNIGYVGTVDYKKLHPDFIVLCRRIAEKIPEVHFTIVGGNNLGVMSDHLFTFTGKVDDVAPYLAQMDCFGYPLRKDHYGTCELVLGEAMAAGVIPVVMNNPAENIIVDNEVNGLVAHSGAEYVALVQQLYAYQGTLFNTTLSNLAKHDAQYLYDIETMIRLWNLAFQELMEEPKRERRHL